MLVDYVVDSPMPELVSKYIAIFGCWKNEGKKIRDNDMTELLRAWKQNHLRIPGSQHFKHIKRNRADDQLVEEEQDEDEEQDEGDEDSEISPSEANRILAANRKLSSNELLDLAHMTN